MADRAMGPDRVAKQEGRFKDDPDDPDMEEEKPQAVTVRFSRVSSHPLFYKLKLISYFCPRVTLTELKR